MKERAMTMEDVSKTLEDLAETETQVKITELTEKADEGCLAQDKPKPEDPREKNLKREIDIQVKSPESKEQKYDWMIAIEKAKKLLEE